MCLMINDELQTQLSHLILQQQVMLDVTQRLAKSSGLGEMLAHIMQGILRGTRADGIRLLLAPHGGGRRRTFGLGPWSEKMAPADTTVMSLVAEHGELALGRDEREAITADLTSLPAELATALAFPLAAFQRLHGVLWIGFEQPHVCDDEEHTFLLTLAGQAAMIVANAQSYDVAQRGQEWLAAVLARTPDPVLVVDAELHLQLINPAAQEMLDATEDAVGQPVGSVVKAAELISLFDSDDGDEPAEIMEYTADNGRTYSPSVSDVRSEDGEMAGWVLVLRDISHFKRLNDNMSEFLSTVSHDMRSPLTFMKGYLDMLGMVGELNDRQAEFVDKIAVGVVQMSDMVEKILEAGKLDPFTGNYELSREPCEIAEIVDKTMSTLSEPAQKKALAVTYSVSDEIPVVNIDRAMLSSAFTNLVENAVKYTPEGGQVQVTVALIDGELVFRVADNGYGISAENQRRLFERNVRIHRKEWKRVKGSGLGLFIVKNVAQRHGGDAWVESVEGQGSTFYLSIPLEGPNLVGGTGGKAG